MKLLHTADWHLGKKLENFSRLDEQEEVLSEICDLADREQVDAILIAGDLFDSFNPATEAVDLFYRTLAKLSNYGARPVIAIAGNHDSPDRIEAPNPLAKECGIILAGYPHTEIQPFELESGLKITKSLPGFIELALPSSSASLRILLTPYANEIRLKTYLGTDNPEAELRQVLQESWQTLADEHCDDQGVNILMTHLFVIKKGETPVEEPEDERPILHIGGAQPVFSENIPTQIQYTALGHLHGHRVVASDPCPIVYSSSPLAYSMSEAEQEKFVILIDAEPGKPVSYEAHPLKSGKKLLRKEFEEVDQAIAYLTENPDVLIELTMKTDNFLTAQERRAILKSHLGLVGNIIPIVKNIDAPTKDRIHQKIDLGKSTKDLFKDYFKHRHGQPPNDELMNLFNEILSQ